MHMVLNVKAESAKGAGDGEIRTYRKWQSESEYSLLHEDLAAGLQLPVSGPAGFQNGYILGWADAAYNVRTEWLVDDFRSSEVPPENIANGNAFAPSKIGLELVCSKQASVGGGDQVTSDCKIVY